MNNIRPLHSFILFTMLWGSLLAGTNFIIDPIQFYRQQDHPIFVKSQRHQIPGLVKNYDFNSILIGTSHSENFLASTLDSLMGTKTINLAISGSSSVEQSRVAAFALAHKQVKHVVWEMNYRSFMGSNYNLLSQGAFPEYLYDSDIKSHLLYLFSIDTLWMSIKNLLEIGPTNLETLNSWTREQADKFDGKQVVRHYCMRAEATKPAATYQAPAYRDTLARDLRPLLQENPNTSFHLFIPPMSYLNFLPGNERNKISSFRKELYELSNSVKNVNIHDFSADISIIDNLMNYKDVEHYSQAISNHILETIGRSDNINQNTDIDLINNSYNQFLVSKAGASALCF